MIDPLIILSDYLICVITSKRLEQQLAWAFDAASVDLQLRLNKELKVKRETINQMITETGDFFEKYLLNGTLNFDYVREILLQKPCLASYTCVNNFETLQISSSHILVSLILFIFHLFVLL